MTSDRNTVRGEVIETLPNLEFRVQIRDSVVRCYTSGRMKLNKIKVVIGDRVDVVLPPGSSVGRIVKRI